MRTILDKGKSYDESTLTHVGWTLGDGAGHEGCHPDDYFVNGAYLGPNEHGIEPVFEDGDEGV